MFLLLLTASIHSCRSLFVSGTFSSDGLVSTATRESTQQWVDVVPKRIKEFLSRSCPLEDENEGGRYCDTLFVSFMIITTTDFVICHEFLNGNVVERSGVFFFFFEARLEE